MKRWTQRMALQLIRDFKESRGCEDCRASYPFFILELDHAPDSKVFNIGTTGKKMDEYSLRIELSKCAVVCRNCHGYRTHKRQIHPRKKKS